MDPRPAVIERRLQDVKRVLAVSGGKGGIGKSVIASTLALILARRGLRAGLLDLDLTGPCDHLILGLDDRFPTEEFGVEPPLLHGVRFMSVVYFVRDRPAPLRGADITGALLELLAITRWGELDALVIDMPPGLGDATLDTVRLLPRAEYLLVATPSRVVVDTVRRTLRFHVELQSRIAGVLQNMERNATSETRDLAAEFDLPYLGSVPYDEGLEAAIGEAERLAGTRAARALDEIAATLFSEAK